MKETTYEHIAAAPSLWRGHVRMMLSFLGAILVFGLGGAAGAGEAAKLEGAGKAEEAFLHYLTIPGAEHAAVRVARREAMAFLNLLEAERQSLPPAQVRLVEGDLRLEIGERDEALECYREVAAAVAGSSEYPVVEPPMEGDPDRRYRPAEAFAFGPGSQRDNWLIRRFFELGANSDAAKEFARIWEIHRAATHPYVIRRSGRTKDGTTLTHCRLILPVGFGARGLMFALDYAQFLEQSQQLDGAFEILLEPFSVMDMDRNPNENPPPRDIDEGCAEGYPIREERGVFARSARQGISRKEFIRLAYGKLVVAGKSDELVATLRARIDAGENRARRLLAQIRLIQDEPDAAIALELAYVKAARLDELSTTYRRGLLFEAYGRTTEAIVALEHALALTPRPWDVPDRDEDYPYPQRRREFPDPATRAGLPAFRTDTLVRLERLYAATGNTEKALESSLRRLQWDPSQLARVYFLEEACKRFADAGEEQAFLDWARRRLSEPSSPAARAGLCWMLGDTKGTIESLVNAGSHEYLLSTQWKERFRRRGRNELRMLLEAIVEANPEDSQSLLALLELELEVEDALARPDAIETMEKLLAADPPIHFPSGKGSWRLLRIRNHYHLAHQLMRLYEQDGQIGKMVALGLRIALSEKPFVTPDFSRQNIQFEYDLIEQGNASLSLAISHADDEQLAALAEALARSPWTAARLQAEPRRALH